MKVHSDHLQVKGSFVRNPMLHKTREEKGTVVIWAYGGSPNFHSQNAPLIFLRRTIARFAYLATFDFREWNRGEKRHEMEKASLVTRTTDLSHFVLNVKNHFSDKNIVLVGNSMGGCNVATLLGNSEFHDIVDGAVLIAPAAYAPEAHEVNLNEDFSNIIRKEGSWKSSNEFSNFLSFPGKKMVVVAEGDEVVYGGITHRYSPPGSGVFRKILRGNGHRMFTNEKNGGVNKDRLGRVSYLLRKFIEDLEKES